MNIPHELVMRFDDVGKDAHALPTCELVMEAKYIIEMIEQGGSDYNDAADNGRKVLRDMRRFISQADKI